MTDENKSDADLELEEGKEKMKVESESGVDLKEESFLEDEPEKREPKKLVNITREAPLNNTEKLEYANTAAGLSAECDELLADEETIKKEKKSQLEKVNGEWAEKNKELRELLKCIKKGSANRVVAAEERFNVELGEMEYWYNDEIVMHREMNPDEKQLHMDLTDDAYPEENTTPGIQIPEWCRRGEKCDYLDHENKGTLGDCTIVDIKILKDEKTGEITKCEIKIDKIPEYVELSDLQGPEKESE